MLDGDDRWRLFVPFGLAPAGLPGRVAVQLGMWSTRLRDRRAEAALSRAERQEKAEAAPPTLGGPHAGAVELGRLHVADRVSVKTRRSPHRVRRDIPGYRRAGS